MSTATVSQFLSRSSQAEEYQVTRPSTTTRPRVNLDQGRWEDEMMKAEVSKA